MLTGTQDKREAGGLVRRLCNPEGGGDIPDKATAVQVLSQRVSGNALGGVVGEGMQGLVLELERKWASKIQREEAMERGGLGSWAGCGGSLYTAEEKGWRPSLIATAHLL